MEIQPYQKQRYLNLSYADIFQEVLQEEINIYNQAYLELDRPLMVITSRIHEKTSNEIGVTFDLTGEIKGSVVCLLDMYNKKIKADEINFFKSLFIESMNILIGRVLTDIEEKFHLMSKISSPKFLEQEAELTMDHGPKESKNITLQSGYKLISLNNEFDCRIFINLNGLKIIKD